MKHKNVLLLVKDMNLYFFSHIEDCQCYAVLEDGKYGSWVNKINTFTTIIILDYCFEPYMASFIRTITKARIILFLWNYVDDEKLKYLEDINNRGAVDDVYTFDQIDALTHGLKHNSTYYGYCGITNDRKIKYDVYFGGSNQNRESKLLQMKYFFEQNNLDFLLYCPDFTDSKNKEYLPYPNFIVNTLESVAILEILREGQTGVSLRTMEAMYYKKLLITSNPSIKYYQFYNPNNIFILGEDTLDNLGTFLTNQYQDIHPKMKEFYSVTNWIERFLKEDPIGLHTCEFNIPLFIKDSTASAIHKQIDTFSKELIEIGSLNRAPIDKVIV